MRRSSFKCLASFAYFTLGAGSLWGTDVEYFVRAPTESGTVIGSCGNIDTCDNNACSCNNNTCCSIITAMNFANTASQVTTISIIENTSNNMYQILYGSSGPGSATVTLCAETGAMIINSNVTSGLTQSKIPVGPFVGTIINFNGSYVYTDCAPDYDLAVFQPAYVDSNSPGAVTLERVVFQNASVSPGFSAINIAGGTLTISGTSLAPNDSTTAFSGNNWTVQNYNSHDPSLIFASTVSGDTYPLGYYTEAFAGPITYISDNTTFSMTNNSGDLVTLSGAITPGSFVSSVLNISPSSGGMALSGDVSVDTVNTYTGTVLLSGINTMTILNVYGDAQLTGTSNSMGTVNVYGSVSLSGAGSVGASTVINIGSSSASGTLTFASGFTLLGGAISLDATVGSFSSSFNDAGNNVTISSQIGGVGVYTKQGSGIQTLTDNSNSYTGGTNITAGVLRISNLGQINSVAAAGITMTGGGTLFTTADMTLPNSITIAGSGGLSALDSTTLTISSDISAPGATLLIGNTQVSSVLGTSASGTVVLQGTGSSIGSIVVGAVDGSNVSYPATLSVDAVSELGNTGALTLQGGGVFATTGNVAIAFPVIVGTGSGTLSLGSIYTLTVSGSISTASGAVGSPALNITGGSAFIFSGDNSSFTGNLLVSNTTLQISNTNNLGSDSSSAELQLSNSILGVTSGTITSQRTLSLVGSNTINVATSASASFTGNFSVASGASLTKASDGTLTILPSIAQSNTNYDLTISAGNLIGNTFSLENTSIVVDSSVAFDQPSSGTFNGTISGSGSVSVTGTSPLTFAPSLSTYTGGTYVYGTLIINGDVLGASSSIIYGSGGTIQTLSSFSMPQPITLTGNLTFSSNSGTILGLSGDITGSGNLIKEGLGSLLLTGDTSYTGNTYVNQGAFVVSGSIVSSQEVVVASGAILAGTGSIADADIYGTIAGGSSQNVVGTLSVVGNLTLENGSSFGTVLSPGHSSLVSVSGPVTIPPDMTYLIAPTAGTYQPFSTVVLRGSSITGKFSKIDVFAFSANFLSSSIRYTETEVILDGISKSITGLVTGQNAINVANALDQVINYNRTQISYTIGSGTIIPSSPPELVPIMASLLFIDTPDEMTYALNQMHPAQLKGMAISQESNAVKVRESLSQRMRNELDITNCQLSDNYDVREKNCCEDNKKTMTAWIGGNGESLFQDNKDNYWGPLAGYRVNTGLLTAGIDGMFSKYFYAGAMGGYTHSHFHWKSGKGTGDINSGYAGLYFSGLGKLFYGNVSIIGGWSQYSADRHIEYGAVDLIAKNDHGGAQLLSHVDTGLNFHYYGLTIRPFESFDYMTQVENAYQEHNAGAWDLAVKKRNAIMMRNELGLQFAKCYCVSKTKWILSPKLSWVREVRVKGSDFTVRFAQAGPDFRTQGYFPNRNIFAPGLAITVYALQDTLKIDTYYNGEFTGKYDSSNFGGQLRYSF